VQDGDTHEFAASATPALCFECHDENDIVAHEFEHGPVSDGFCLDCHDPHSSSSSQLLIAPGAALCASCHEDTIEEIADSEYVHDPAEDDCIDCHQPHGGPNPYLLTAARSELCGECHDDVVEGAEEASVKHASVLQGDACLHCHSPHSSSEEAILKEPQIDLCLRCHNGSERRGKPKPELADIRARLDANPRWHEPIREGGCTGCHEPHGGESHRLLSKAFPPGFYASFEAGKYGLCFSCHEATLATSERTRTQTGFRDGDQNLHFVHVTREKRGRSCRVCHDLHAGDAPALIHQKVRFGKWMLPVGFEKAEAGGSCHPGCHEAEEYDRDRE
jgi:predicted CXXCH cytochrome family protein